MSTGKPREKSVRMSRPQPKNSRPGKRFGTPKELFSDEQLAEIGAIVLIWNQIDTFLDFLTYVSLKPPIYLLWEVARRFRGVDAKIELLRLAADRNKILDDAAKKCIKTTLDGVVDCKRYRDNIAHSVVYDIEKGIVHTFKRNTNLVPTLVTMDALHGLYQRLDLLLKELRDIDLLYRLGDEDGAYAVYPEERDPPARRRTRDVPIQTAQSLQSQKLRLSLPPLPEFPDEGEGRSLAEDTEPQPHSARERIDDSRPI
jgi:hypothetical protein